MLGLKHFYRSLASGSIRPPANKAETLRSRIMPTPIPEQLLLPLQQHQGMAADVCVQVGERVRKYQLLASSRDKSCVPIHAPSSGEIIAIDTEIDLYNTGHRQICISLHCDGQDEALELHGERVEDHRSLSREQLLSRIESAGLCGMGGAGFPVAQKLAAGRKNGIDKLLINAAECEPYISCDEALLRERASSVIRGAEMLRDACEANEAVIAIEADKSDAIAALRTALVDSDLKLELVSPRYPVGEERQLLYNAMGIKLSRGDLPVDAGILVFNAGTAAAVCHAVIENRPCISRIVSVSGAPLRTPKNFDVLIGTPVAHLLALCGIDQEQHRQTIIGGSLMGKYLADTSYPICKTSNSVIATSEAEFPQSELQPPELACIRCGYCADACPENLLPQQLLVYTKAEQFERASNYGLADCIECGACAYVCPSKIPLVQYYRSAKESIAREQDRRESGKQWQQRFQVWQYRHKKNTESNKDSKKAAATASDSTPNEFSRQQAREEIAAAVARVKQKRSRKKD